MALPQHSIKLFSVEIRPNSGSSPGHGCQDHIQKHLAGQFEVLGLAMKEIHFQPCVPGSHLLSWLEMPGLLQRISFAFQGEKQSSGALTDALVTGMTEYLTRNNVRGEEFISAHGLKVHFIMAGNSIQQQCEAASSQPRGSGIRDLTKCGARL